MLERKPEDAAFGEAGEALGESGFVEEDLEDEGLGVEVDFEDEDFDDDDSFSLEEDFEETLGDEAFGEDEREDEPFSFEDDFSLDEEEDDDFSFEDFEDELFDVEDFSLEEDVLDEEDFEDGDLGDLGDVTSGAATLEDTGFSGAGFEGVDLEDVAVLDDEAGVLDGVAGVGALFGVDAVFAVDVLLRVGVGGGEGSELWKATLEDAKGEEMGLGEGKLGGGPWSLAAWTDWKLPLAIWRARSLTLRNMMARGFGMGLED